MIEVAEQHGVGIYPETKHSSYFDPIGLSLEEPLLDALRRIDGLFVDNRDTAAAVRETVAERS